MAINSKPIAQFFLLRFFAAVLLSLECSVVLAQNQAVPSACGPLNPPGQYGPWDYRTDKDKLDIVISAHFTPEVEALIRGKTSESPGGDLDYTLRAIPNNHRALIAIMRLGEIQKTPQPKETRYSITCWFERAIQFRPDDSIVRMIYSTYLNKQRKTNAAREQLKIASTYAKDSGITHYNIGLHYFDLKDYDQALVQAHQAVALDFPGTQLRDKLQSVGKWVEPSARQAAQPDQVTATPSTQ